MGRTQRLMMICMMTTLATAVMAGCASKSLREQLNERREGDGTRKTGPAMDHFYLDSPFQKERPSTYKEFYYKHCEFVRRTRFPARNEWECTEPVR